MNSVLLFISKALYWISLSAVGISLLCLVFQQEILLVYAFALGATVAMFASSILLSIQKTLNVGAEILGKEEVAEDKDVGSGEK